MRSTDLGFNHCLVIGASGFIGQALCHAIQKQGARVRALLRRPLSGPWDEVLIHDLCQSMPTDLQQTLFKDIDVVFHLATVAYSAARNADPETYWRLNLSAA